MNKRTIHLTMLSLPVIMVAIAFFLFLAAQAPMSDGMMGATTATVEQSAVFSIEADGKAVAYFKSLTDSMTTDGAVPADSGKTPFKVITAGCWANDMPMMPSCHGRILVPGALLQADSMVQAMNKDIRRHMKREADRQRKYLEKIKKRQAYTDYYMSVHNVQDEGFNIMAEYAERIKKEKNNAERLIVIFDKAATAKNVAVRMETEYKVITPDRNQKTCTTACRKLPDTYSHGFIMLQTEDKKMPSHAKAVYVNRLVRCHADSGDVVSAAGICGMETPSFNVSNMQTMITTGHATGRSGHDMPSLLVPDGSPVFSKNGFFLGISMGGTIADVRKTGNGNNGMKK